MKVILYMAMTANGMIARSDDDTSWISEEEWNCYSEMTRRAGCLVVGRRTYNILTEQSEFAELKDVTVVAVSRGDVALKQDNHHVAHSPTEALQLLEDYPEVVVAGGGILNASFLKESLVDEMYLDIEPILFSDGVPFAAGETFEAKLELLGQKNITPSEIQLHYRVVKD